MPPAELATLLLGVLRGRALEPVAVLRTRREGIRARENGRAVADVTVDTVTVLDGRRVRERFVELEVEALPGGADALPALERVLLEAGASQGDGRSKAFRALGFFPAERSAPPRVGTCLGARPVDDRDAGRRADRARPGDEARSRPGGAPPGTCRNPAAASGPAGGAAPARPRVGRVAPRGARLARGRAGAGTRPRRPPRAAREPRSPSSSRTSAGRQERSCAVSRRTGHPRATRCSR